MAVVFTIEGVTTYWVPGSLHIQQPANGRATAAMRLQLSDVTSAPDLYDEVLITEGGTPVFGGLIDQITIVNAGALSTDNVFCDLSCVDYNVYADRRTISPSFPSQSLDATLTTLVDDVLSPYGVTLDAGQVTGPTLPALAYTIKTVTEILNDLAERTGEFGEPYVWEIDAAKVLRMYQSSTNPAPFNLTTSPYPEVIGDIVVDTKRGSDYANNVVIYVPPTAEYNRVETFSGDGVTTTFALTYTLFAWRGYVTYGVNNETLDFAGNGATWEYDPVTNTIERVTGAPTSGTDNISITFDGTFSVNLTASDAGEIAANGQTDRVYVLDSIPSDTTAQALADSLLAKHLQSPKTVTYTTREAGLFSGMGQTITVTNRGLTSATATLTEIVTSDFGLWPGLILEREVTAVVDDSQTNLGRDHRDVYRRWLGDTKLPRVAAATSTSTGTPGGGGGTGSSDKDIDVYKTADETVNGSDTFQDDDHLLFPVEANTVYWVWMVLYTTAANTTPNFKLQWTYPTSTTIKWGNFEGTTNYWGATGAATGNLGVLTESQPFAFGGTGAAGNPRAVTIAAQVTVGATAGTVRLQWAQNTSTGVDCTIHQGSWLRYRKIYQ